MDGHESLEMALGGCTLRGMVRLGGARNNLNMHSAESAGIQQ